MPKPGHSIGKQTKPAAGATEFKLDDLRSVQTNSCQNYITCSGAQAFRTCY